MGSITLKECKSPFNADMLRTVEIPYEKGLSLLEIKARHLPAVVNEETLQPREPFRAEIDFAVMLNAQLIPKDTLGKVYPMPGDLIMFVPVMGDDFATFVGIAVAIVSIAISAGALGPAGLAWFGAAFAAGAPGAIITSLAVSILGGLAVSALTKSPDLPTMDLHSGFDTTQTYSWNPQTIQQPGASIPRVFGTHKLYGNVIASNIENVNDKQYLNVLICLGMGPVNRVYDFKINDQPTEKLQGVEIYTRHGNLDQDPIPNFNDTKSEYPLSVKIVKDNPYTYVTIGNDFNGLEVDITFPYGLYYANNAGGLDAMSVDLRIEIRKQGDADWIAITHKAVAWTEQIPVESGHWSIGYWQWYDGWGTGNWVEIQSGGSNPNAYYEGQNVYYYEYYYLIARWIQETTYYTVNHEDIVDYVTVSAAQNSAIRRTYKSQMNLGSGKYEIRISNLSVDQTSSRYADDMYVSAVREVYTDDFEYPRMVLVGIKALATDQLSGSLRFSCMCDGAIIDTDYGLSSRQRKFTNNPAWVGFDVITQPVLDNQNTIIRYDKMLPTEIDIPKIRELASRNDEMVPDGTGGTEHRHEFDGVFDAGMSLWETSLRIFKSCRAIPFWQGVMLTLAINKPRTARHMITMGSTVKSSFKERWSSAKERPRELKIDFTNKENEYQRDTLQVFHPQMDSYHTPLNLDMIGVVRSSQAWRDGFFMLSGNKELTNFVTITVPIQMIEATVGDLVEISHDIPQWGHSGRLEDVGLDNSHVYLDRDVEMEEGYIYVIRIKLKSDDIIQRTVAGVTDGRSVEVTVPFEIGSLPEKYCEYAFGKQNIVTKPFSILSIKPSMDLNFTLLCLEYNETIYNVDSGQDVLPTPNYSALSTTPDISNLRVTEELKRSGNAILSKMIFSWDSKNCAKFVIGIQGNVPYQVDENTTMTIFRDLESNMEYIGNTYVFYGQHGITYFFNVRGYGYDGTQTPHRVLRYTANIQKLPPADITGLRYTLTDRILHLQWNECADVDLHHYRIVVGNPTTPKDVIETTANSISLPVSNGQYKFNVYAVDFLGNKSINPATVTVDIEGTYTENYLIQDFVDLSSGTYEGTICYTASDQLRRPSAHGSPISLPVGNARDCDTQNYINAFEDQFVSDMDYLVNWFSTMDFAEPGTFTSAVIDLGKIYEGYLSYDGTRSYNVYDDASDINGSVSEFEGIYVSDFDREVGVIRIRAFVSQDALSWKEVYGGFVKARYLQFKVYFDTRNPSVEHLLTDLWYQLDVPDISDGGKQSITDSGKITFNKTFNAVKAVSVAAVGGGQVDVTSYDETGINVTIVGGGTKDVTWIAEGY
ncbi:MAG: hypothetical protein BWX92_02799 [Deltaproteobacteria bacterium ADurb.Bin135]|nr:MAG: hypothetical protein BWX92_02799 [Deltaproteobacteria bacterium ADurb.Bin135]